MLTKADIKFYQLLSIKKFRHEKKLFIAEGLRLISDGLNSNFFCDIFFVTDEFANQHKSLIKLASKKQIRIERIKNSDMQKICNTVNPQGAAAVFKMNEPELEKLNSGKIIIALENISDPGNLGTIIRTCDWFGITNIIANQGCADLYNPKVVRSTMGSIFHINFFQTDAFYTQLRDLRNTSFQIITADLNGKNIYDFCAAKKTIFCFCNEAFGPSEELKKISDEYITIPSKGKAESLNVASAAAIIISHFSNLA